MFTSAQRLLLLGDLSLPAAARSAAIVLIILLSSSEVGRRIRLWAARAEIPVAWCVDLALGLGFIGLALMFTGIFIGVSSRIAMLAILVMCAPAALSLCKVVGKTQRSRGRPQTLVDSLIRGSLFDRFLGLLIVFFLGWALLSSISPEIEPDALSYHLELPRRWLEAGRIVNPHDLYMSGYPILGESLFWPLWALGAPLAAKWLHLAAGAITVFSVMGWAGASHGRRAGLLAGLLIASVPGWMWSGTTANTDLFLCLFVWAALALILSMEANPGAGPSTILKADRGALALAGAAAGLALNTKLTAVIFVAAMAPLVMGLSLRRSRHRYGRAMIVVSIADLGIFLAPAAALFSLWLLKNELLTGLAAYPLAADPFRQGCEVLRIADHPWCSGRPECALWCADSALVGFLKVRLLNDFGMGKGLAGFMLLPWNLTFNVDRFGGVALGIGWLALWPLALGLRKSDVGTISLLFWSALSFLLWSAGTQQSRMLLPLLPASAAALVVPLSDPDVLRGSERVRAGAARLFTVLLLASAIAGLPPVYPRLYQGFVFRLQPATTLLSRANGASLLASRAPNDSANLLRATESKLGPGSVVLTSGVEEHLYTDLVLISPAQSPRGFAIEYELQTGSCDRVMKLISEYHVKAAIGSPAGLADRFGRCGIGLSTLASTEASPFVAAKLIY